MPLRRFAKTLLVLGWIVLPIAIVAGLWQYGHAVPQSVRWNTYITVATYSFWACAFAGLVAVLLPKRLEVPRLLVGFLSLLMLVIGAVGFPGSCYPRYLGDKATRLTERTTSASAPAPRSERCGLP